MLQKGKKYHLKYKKLDHSNIKILKSIIEEKNGHTQNVLKCIKEGRICMAIRLQTKAEAELINYNVPH